jgi:hypothetical protein
MLGYGPYKVHFFLKFEKSYVMKSSVHIFGVSPVFWNWHLLDTIQNCYILHHVSPLSSFLYSKLHNFIAPLLVNKFPHGPLFLKGSEAGPYAAPLESNPHPHNFWFSLAGLESFVGTRQDSPQRASGKNIIIKSDHSALNWIKGGLHARGIRQSLRLLWQQTQ